MSVLADVLAAKQLLSARYLRQPLLAAAAGTSHALRVRDAIAQAPRNVHAIGVGTKLVHGRPTGGLCVRFYVRQKLALSLLPPIDRLPEQLDGIATDVIESPPAFITPKRKAAGARTSGARAVAARPAAPPRPQAAGSTCTDLRQQRQRPVIAGISAGHFNITAGTIGYFCRSVAQGDDPAAVYLLSNNHVFADVNAAAIGDDIYQPGTADGGTNADAIAQLSRFRRIDLNGPANRVDAAIAALAAGVQHQVTICSIGALQGTRDAEEDLPVRKHGRTTGYTEGIITDVSYDATVGMDHNNPSVWALFANQIRIGTVSGHPAFGLSGDSGSLVVARDAPDAVGLYFAGPPDGSYGIANPLADVLNLLQIELL
jgi:hypothetical protein